MTQSIPRLTASRTRRGGLHGPRGAAALLIALLLAGCSQPELELADGSHASWDELRGKWLLINYWAEWCAPCRHEIPELNRLHEVGRENAVVVLGVNYDGLRGDTLNELIDRMDIRFPVLVNDPGPSWDQAPPSVLPSTLVVGPDGELREVLVGPQTFESLAEVVELPAEGGAARGGSRQPAGGQPVALAARL